MGSNAEGNTAVKWKKDEQCSIDSIDALLFLPILRGLIFVVVDWRWTKTLFIDVAGVSVYFNGRLTRVARCHAGRNSEPFTNVVRNCTHHTAGALRHTCVVRTVPDNVGDGLRVASCATSSNSSESSAEVDAHPGDFNPHPRPDCCAVKTT